MIRRTAQVGFEISLRRLYCSTALHLQWFLGRSSVCPWAGGRGLLGASAWNLNLLSKGSASLCKGLLYQPALSHQYHTRSIRSPKIHPKNPPRNQTLAFLHPFTTIP